jgi:hypothetical protein
MMRILLLLGLLAGSFLGTWQVDQSAIKQKHSKLYPDYHTKTNILHEVQQGKDVDKTIQIINDYAESDYEASLPAYPDLELVRLACSADAIIIASPVSSEANITASGEFLYTDYVMHVESTISGSTLVGSEIIVTRPGGAATINGRSVLTAVSDFPLFQPHARYLLFLRFLPDTKTYRAFQNGSFLLDGKAVAIDGQSLSIPSAQHEGAFLTEVRAAANAPCAGVAHILNN